MRNNGVQSFPTTAQGVVALLEIVPEADAASVEAGA